MSLPIFGWQQFQIEPMTAEESHEPRPSSCTARPWGAWSPPRFDAQEMELARDGWRRGKDPAQAAVVKRQEAVPLDEKVWRRRPRNEEPAMTPMEQASFVLWVQSALGLSQEALAGRIGVHQATVKRWRLGDRIMPRRAIDVLRKLVEDAAHAN